MAPRTQQTQTQTPDAAAATTNGKAPVPASVTDETSMVGQAIARAIKLKEAKAAILTDIGEVRMILGIAVKQGLVKDDESKWIAENLPKRTRGKGDSEDES